MRSSGTEQLSATALYDHHENTLNLSERTAGARRLFLTTGKQASQTGAPTSVAFRTRACLRRPHAGR